MANIFTNLNLIADSNFYITQKINSIGYVGENTVTRLNIEVPEITEGTVYELETENSAGEKNVALLSTDAENSTLYLDFTARMLTVNDLIMMQLRVTYADNSIKKSNRFAMKIAKSISATDYYEEYAVSIFDQLVNECRDIIEGAESYAVRAETAAVNAEAYSESASASAQAASASEATASTASTVAVNAAASAESASTSAHTSAETATTAASSASASASTAQTSAQTAQSASVTAQSASETAQTASTAATSAQTAAETAANTATTAASNASASATAAANSATAASTSATSASVSATSAVTSETNAAASAALASTSAANANTSATNAANSASSAATSATNAHTSEVNASNSETNASTSAAEAEASAESIAASVAQINENTYRINDLEAIIAGYQLTDLPTGAIATVTDGTALLMPSLKVGIEPVQDLHGYDHPWVGGAGKNKLNNVRTTTNISGITFTINDDGSVFIAGGQTASDTAILNLIANNQNYYNLTDFGLNYNVDYTINGCPNGGGNNYRLLFRSGGSAGNIVDNGSGANFNISSESSTLVWMPCIVITSGYTIPNSGLLFKPMIRLATETDPTFEPYSNICPISGWTAANVVRTGKNLFDESILLECDGWTVSNGIYSGSSGQLFNKYGNGVPNLVFKQNTQYTFSFTYGQEDLAGAGFVFVFRYTDNTMSVVNGNPETIGFLSITSTAGKSIKQIELSYGSNRTIHLSNMQLEEGSTATTYEPYTGQTYNIQFRDGDNPLTVYGGTLDVTSGELTVTDAHIASYDAETLPSTWISDRDVYAEGATPTTGAEVVYKLANSVTYHLTPTQVRTLVGNNNIWADTGDIISGKYYKSLT